MKLEKLSYTFSRLTCKSMEIKIRRRVRQTYRLIELRRRPKMSHTLRGGEFSTKVLIVRGRRVFLIDGAGK